MLHSCHFSFLSFILWTKQRIFINKEFLIGQNQIFNFSIYIINHQTYKEKRPVVSCPVQTFSFSCLSFFFPPFLVSVRPLGFGFGLGFGLSLSFCLTWDLDLVLALVVVWCCCWWWCCVVFMNSADMSILCAGYKCFPVFWARSCDLLRSSAFPSTHALRTTLPNAVSSTLWWQPQVFFFLFHTKRSSRASKRFDKRSPVFCSQIFSTSFARNWILTSAPERWLPRFSKK